MNDEEKKKVNSYSDMTKTVLLIGAAIVSSTLYIHTTFATNVRVDVLERDFNKEKQNTIQAIQDQRKLGCLMAIKLSVNSDDLPIFCINMK